MELRHKLESEMSKNDYHLHIYSVGDLIAVWRYMNCNRFTRSVDFSRVPKEWRFSTAAFEAIRIESGAGDRGGPITYEELEKSQLSLTYVRREMSTVSCHHSGGGNARWPDLDVQPQQVAGVIGKSGKVIPLILDFNALVRVCKEVGISSRVKYKIIDGNQYVIFIRAPSSPKIQLGVAYPTDNKKIIQLAIGRLGVKNFVSGGARLTIYLTVPLSILKATLSDQGLMASMIGHVAMDLVKIGISSIIGYIFGIMAGGFVGWIAAPLVVAIVVGSLTFAALRRIDNNLQLTNRLIAEIEKYVENISLSPKDSAVQTMHEAWQYFFQSNYRGPIIY